MPMAISLAAPPYGWCRVIFVAGMNACDDRYGSGVRPSTAGLRWVLNVIQADFQIILYHVDNVRDALYR